MKILYGTTNKIAKFHLPFILAAKPHEKRVEGFPLDSLSIDIGSGKYYYDLKIKDVSTSVDDGVRKFFSESLKMS